METVEKFLRFSKMKPDSPNAGFLIISFLSGLLGAASFHYDFLFFIYPLTIIFLGYLLDLSSGKARILLGYLYGFGFFLAGTWWLGLIKGYFYLPFLLALYESIFFLLPVVFSKRFFEEKSSLRFFIFTLLLFLFEVLRGQGRFGFPWMSAGYYLSSTFLKNLLFYFGITGAGFLIYLWAGSVLSALNVRSNFFKLLALAITFIFGLGAFLPANADFEAKRIKVVLLQDNILPEEKHEKDPYKQVQIRLDHFFEMVKKIPEKADLVVFPETAFPYVYPFEKFWDRYFSEKARQKNAVLLIGAEAVENGRYYNSILAYTKKGYLFSYHKRYLVPFGEYVPYRNKLRILPVVRNTTDFSKGEKEGIVKLPFNHVKAGLGICWESAIPFYGTNLARKGANLLIFITNDNWFLYSNQSLDHWRHTKAQSDASGLPVVQAANAGITGFYYKGEEKKLLPWTVSSMTVEIYPARANFSVLKFQKYFESFSIIFSVIVFIISRLTYMSAKF